jgi:hypothetical protein
MGTGTSTVNADSVVLVWVYRWPGCEVWCINIACSGYTVGGSHTPIRIVGALVNIQTGCFWSTSLQTATSADLFGTIA